MIYFGRVIERSSVKGNIGCFQNLFFKLSQYKIVHTDNYGYWKCHPSELSPTFYSLTIFPFGFRQVFNFTTCIWTSISDTYMIMFTLAFHSVSGICQEGTVYTLFCFIKIPTYTGTTWYWKTYSLFSLKKTTCIVPSSLSWCMILPGHINPVWNSIQWQIPGI
jgi:hypothetical protein